MQPIQKQRNSNLELYRIIDDATHRLPSLCRQFRLDGRIGEWTDYSQEPVLLCLRHVGNTGINCFVFITGYFMCKSSITLRKFLKLFLEVELYNIVIFSMFVLSGYQDFSIKELLFKLVPLRMVETNFTGCFLWFYLCIPFLTVLVTHLDKKRHGLLVLLCLGIYTMTSTLPGFSVIMNYVTWFSVLFFIASYIRLYGLLPRLSTSKWGV